MCAFGAARVRRFEKLGPFAAAPFPSPPPPTLTLTSSTNLSSPSAAASQSSLFPNFLHAPLALRKLQPVLTSTLRRGKKKKTRGRIDRFRPSASFSGEPSATDA